VTHAHPDARTAQIRTVLEKKVSTWRFWDTRRSFLWCPDMRRYLSGQVTFLQIDGFRPEIRNSLLYSFADWSVTPRSLPQVRFVNSGVFIGWFGTRVCILVHQYQGWHIGEVRILKRPPVSSVLGHAQVPFGSGRFSPKKPDHFVMVSVPI
jgi:hypothetical protein